MEIIQAILLPLVKKMNAKYVLIFLISIAILFFGRKCYESALEARLEEQKARQAFELEKYKLDLINKK